MQQAKRLGKYNEYAIVMPAGDIRFKDRQVWFLIAALSPALLSCTSC